MHGLRKDTEIKTSAFRTLKFSVFGERDRTKDSRPIAIQTINKTDKTMVKPEGAVRNWELENGIVLPLAIP